MKTAKTPEVIKGENYFLELVEEEIRPAKLARWVEYKGAYKGAEVEFSVRIAPEGITYYVSLRKNTYPIKEELKKAGFYYSSGEWDYKGETPPPLFKEADFSNLKLVSELTKEELREILEREEKENLGLRLCNLDDYVEEIYERIQRKKQERENEPK